LIKGTWELTPGNLQASLIADLTRLVQAGGRSLYVDFPVATKITELALIGRKHP
jgi:hypothetical protein